MNFKKFMHKYLLSIIFYGFIGLIILATFVYLFALAYQDRGYLAFGGEWVFLFVVPLLIWILTHWKGGR